MRLLDRVLIAVVMGLSANAILHGSSLTMMFTLGIIVGRILALLRELGKQHA